MQYQRTIGCLISISSDPVKYLSSPLNTPCEYLTAVKRPPVVVAEIASAAKTKFAKH